MRISSGLDRVNSRYVTQQQCQTNHVTLVMITGDMNCNKTSENYQNSFHKSCVHQTISLLKVCDIPSSMFVDSYCSIFCSRCHRPSIWTPSPSTWHVLPSPALPLKSGAVNKTLCIVVHVHIFHWNHLRYTLIYMWILCKTFDFNCICRLCMIGVRFILAQICYI